MELLYIRALFMSDMLFATFDIAWCGFEPTWNPFRASDVVELLLSAEGVPFLTSKISASSVYRPVPFVKAIVTPHAINRDAEGLVWMVWRTTCFRITRWRSQEKAGRLQCPPAVPITLILISACALGFQKGSRGGKICGCGRIGSAQGDSKRVCQPCNPVSGSIRYISSRR